MELLNLDDIYHMAEFTQFKLNKNHWPYLASYEISLEVPVEKNEFMNENKADDH